jgi:hypothetical protein
MPLPKKIKAVAVMGAFLCMLGASRCSSLIIDRSANAAEAGDQTVQLQGGGKLSQKGYLFFQKKEGTPLTDTVTLLVPKNTCKRDSCARYQFFRKDGSQGAGAGIPKGSNTATVTLAELVGHDGPSLVTDDGEYSAIVQLFYIGRDGEEYSVLMNGFVRLNVLSKGYDPVGCDDPAVAFRLKVGDACQAQFTTAGRTVSCGTGCDK